MTTYSLLPLRQCLEHLLRAEFPNSFRTRFSAWNLRSSLPTKDLGKRSRAGRVVLSCYRCRAAIAASGSVGAEDGVFPVSGMEEALMGFITGERKAVEVVNSVWKRIVKKGDIVIDATCGNGYDTLMLLSLVADESSSGVVYSLDIQKSALESTSNLLGQFSTSKERQYVKLFHLCHSKMEDVIPKDALVRLIAFNLGYLPGGDKSIITLSQTTLLALEAASRILQSGGLISLVVYVGHPGGREELETVQSFASCLPSSCWVCCKFEVVNRPMAPVIVLIFRK